MLRWAVFTLVVAIAPAVAAEPLATLTGRVTDAKTDQPIEGAVVYVVGADRESKMRTTGRDGSYRVELPPGDYDVVFISGSQRGTTKVRLVEGKTGTADGAVLPDAGEVIEIEGTLAAPRAPKPKGLAWTRVPKYSDEAILSDAWTKAWLLLAIDDTGEVTMFKFLKRPGYDLEDIAAAEAFRLRFTPATDADGNAVPSRVVWPIEWPANSWMLAVYEYHRAPGLAELPPFPPRSAAAAVPCAGSGPINITSMLYRGYRDCSVPDLTEADGETWILPTDE
jgi:hypothetical protein